MPLNLSEVYGDRDQNNANSMFSNYDAVENIANGMSGNEQQPSVGYRKMNGIESGLAGLAQLSRDISQSSGFGQYYQSHGGLQSLLTPEGAGRFLLNLPVGMASAIPAGVANLGAMVTGSDVNYGADVESGLIRDKQLTAEQRIASGVTGVIDTAGLLWGGSGSLINEGRNIGRVARGAEPIASRATGAGLYSTPGKAIAFDVAEEGAEEVAQSVSEDIIQDQLNEGSIGRAFEAGIMGAMGGGVMSGGAQALRYARGGASADQETTTSPATKPVWAEFDPLAASYKPGAVIPQAHADAVYRQSVGRLVDKQHGSVSAIVTPAFKDLGPNETSVGSALFRRMFDESQEGENRVVWFFNGRTNNPKQAVTRDKLDEIFRLSDEDCAKQLNEILDNNYGSRRRRIVLGKNPATLNGACWVSVSSIHAGKDIQCNTYTEQVLNADEDSDQPFIMIDTDNFSPNRWASELFVHELASVDEKTGERIRKANIDSAYGVFQRGKSVNREKARKELMDNVRLQMIDQDPLTQDSTELSRIKAELDAAKKALADAAEEMPDASDKDAIAARNLAIADNLTKIGNIVAQAYLSYGRRSAGMTEEQINGIARSLAGRAIDEAYRSYAAGFDAIPSNVHEAATTAEEIRARIADRAWSEGPQPARTPGAVGQKGSKVNPWAFGVGETVSEAYFDKIFRDNPSLTYNIVKKIILSSHADKDGKFFDTLDFGDAFSAAVLYTNHVVAAGQTPINAINNFFIAACEAGVYSYRHNVTIDGRPDAIGTIFGYIVAREGITDEYNNCLDQWNGYWDQEVLSAIKKSHIQGLGNLDLNETNRENMIEVVGMALKDPNFGWDFIRDLGDFVLASNFFDDEFLTRIYPGYQPGVTILTLSDFIEELAKSPAGDTIIINDATLNEFVHVCIAAMRGENSKTDRIALSFAEGLSSSNTLIHFNDKNELEINAADMPAATELSETIAWLLNPDAAIRFGVMDVRQYGLVTESQIAQDLAWGDAEHKVNAAGCINFAGKFYDIISWYLDPQNADKITDEVDKLPERIRRELSELSDIDIIHQEICHQLVQGKGNSEVLTRLVNINMTYDEKNRYINDLFGRLDPTVIDGFYASSAKSPVDWSSPYVELSPLQRLNQGRVSATRYRSKLIGSYRKEVAHTQKALKIASDLGISKAKVILTAARMRSMDYDYDIVNDMFADSSSVQPQSSEKGKAIVAAVRASDQTEYGRHGARYSNFSYTIDIPMGVNTSEQFTASPWGFRRLLWDKTFTLRIEKDGRTKEVSHIDFWRSIDERYNGGEISDAMIDTLLERYPQAVSWLGGFKLTSTTIDGQNVSSSLSRTGSLSQICYDICRAETQEEASNIFTIYKSRAIVEQHAFEDPIFFQYLYAVLPANYKNMLKSGQRIPRGELQRYGKLVVDGLHALINMQGIDPSRSIFQRSSGERFGGKRAPDANDFEVNFAENVSRNLKASLDSFIAITNAMQASVFGSLSGEFERVSYNLAMDSWLSSVASRIVGDKINVSVNGESQEIEFNPSSFNNGVLPDVSKVFNESAYGNLLGVSALIIQQMAATDPSFRGAISTYAEDVAVGNNLNGDVKDAFKVALESALTEETLVGLVPESVSSFYPSRAIFDSMFGTNEVGHDPTVFETVLKRIGERVGDKTLGGNYERLVKMYQECFPASTGFVADPYRQRRLMAELNSLYFRYYADESGATVWNINPDLISDNEKLMDGIIDFVEGFKDPDFVTYTTSFTTAIDTLPLPDVSGYDDSMMLQNILEVVNSGKVPGNILMNGAEVKWMAGVDIVPQDRSLEETISSKKIATGEAARADVLQSDLFKHKASEVLEKLDTDYRGTKILKDDGTVATVESSRMYLQSLGDKDVIVFDSRYNVHGIFSEFMPPIFSESPGSKDWNRFTGALNRVLMNDMENGVLKSRKGVKISNIELVKKDPDRVDIDATFSGSPSNEEALRLYGSFISDAADELLKSTYAQKLKDQVGISKDDFMLFLQAMTPAWQVKLSDGSYACIDVINMFSSQLWQQRISEITQDGKQIESIELLVLPMRSISGQVIRQIGAIDGKNDADISARAFDAMIGWDSFDGIEKLTYDEIIGDIDLLTYGKSNVISGLAATPQQNFIFSALDEQGYQSHSEPTDRHLYSITRVRENDKKHTILSRYLGNMRPLLHIDTEEANDFSMVFGSLSQFGKDFSIGVAPTLITASEEIRRLDDTMLYEECTPGRNLNVLVVDGIQISNAAQWGLSALSKGQQGFIYVPTNILENSAYSYLAGSPQVKISIGDGRKYSSVQCYRIPIQGLDQIALRRDYREKSYLGTTPRDRIIGVLLDEDGKYPGSDPAVHIMAGICDRLKYTVKKTFEFDISEYLPSPSVAMSQAEEKDSKAKVPPTATWLYGIMSQSEEDELRDRLHNDPDNKVWNELFGSSVEKLSSKRAAMGSPAHIKQEVLAYLDNSDRKTDTKISGQVVAMVKLYNRVTGKIGGYLPVLLPNNIARADVSLSTISSGKKLSFICESEYRLMDEGENPFVKLSVFSRAADKAMAIIDTYLSGKEGYEAWQSWEAAKSRLQGRDRQLFYTSAYNYMLREGMHLLFRPADDGNGVVLRDCFKDYFQKHDKAFSDTLAGKMDNQSESIWTAINAGNDFGVLSENEIRVMRRVLMNCRIFSINPLYAFGAGVYHEGVSTAATSTEGAYDKVFVLDDDQARVNANMAFAGLTVPEIACFFHAAGLEFNLCASPDTGSSQSQDAPVFNANGLVRTQQPGDEGYVYRRVIFDEVTAMGHSSDEETLGGPATASPQQRLNQIAMYGVRRDAAFADLYASYLAQDLQGMGLTQATNLAELDGKTGAYLNKDLMGSWLNSRYYQEIDNIISGLGRRRRVVEDSSNETSPEVAFRYDQNTKDINSQRYTQAVDRLMRACGWNTRNGNGVIPSRIIWELVNAQDGYTQGEKELPISFSSFVDLINRVANNYERHGLFVYSDAINDEGRGRYAVPELSNMTLAFIDARTANGTSHKGVFDLATYKESMERNRLEAIETTSKIEDPAKRLALRKFQQAMRKVNGEEMDSLGEIWAGYDLMSLATTDTVVEDLVKAMGFDVEVFKSFQEQQREKLNNAAKMGHKRNLTRATTTGRHKVYQDSYHVYNTYGELDAVLDHIVEISRAMSVLNLGVVLSNPATRLGSQSIMEFGLRLAQEGRPSPYIGQERFTDEGTNYILGNYEYNRVFKAFRLASAMGADIETMINEGRNVDDIVQAMNKLDEIQNKSLYRKMITGAFNLANGFDLGIKQQEKIFLIRLMNFIEQDPLLKKVYLDQKDEQGRTLLEQEFTADPASFFLRCFARDEKNGMPQLYSAVKLALNSARTGDLAQDHWLATLIYDMGQTMPIGRFMFNTCICRFPKYAFNATDKLLKWFLPMSTINYVMTQVAANVDNRLAAEKKIDYSHNLELTQKYVNLREAVMCDVTHLGVSAALGILLVIGEGIEPPDDPDKMGDPDEWLIGGNRIGESWWTSDMFGVLLPSALSMKAVSLGHPEAAIPLLLNGSLNACYSNPFIRTADCLNVLTDWEDGTVTDYEKVKEQFKNAKGGAPGFLDYLQTNAAVGFGSWLTGLFTPSFWKELYRSGQDFEHSYKRVYQTTPTGKLSEAGANGATERTTFQDAMWRRACQQNPFLAIIMDASHPGAATGYKTSEQPLTIYYDNAEMASAEKWSIAGMSKEEQNAVMLLMYNYVNSHTVEQMQAEGFHPDNETLFAFGSYLWDSYYDVKHNWDLMMANGAFDATTLGDGDEELGWQLYYEAKAAKDAVLQSYSRMYYDKIKNSYLGRGWQQYNRYATSYRTDSNGEVYATGMRRQGMLPFLSAPGTTTNPEGTAGYENDFMSISAVTGQPMDQRALVPVDNYQDVLPTFEDFSKDKDGSSYSGYWPVYSGDTTNNTTQLAAVPGTEMETIKNAIGKVSSGTPTTTKKTTPYRSGGSGGSGGSRRSSGSPSTYVPGISSRNYTPNTPNAATARASRAYDTQFDYLRPNVETKGSRDAYKRGDM